MWGSSRINIRTVAIRYRSLWLIVVMNQQNIANYADENTSYVSEKSIYEIAKSLEEGSRFYFKWLSNNYFQGMQLNIMRC